MSNIKTKNTGVIHSLAIAITILMVAMLTAGLLPGFTVKVNADGLVGAHHYTNDYGEVFLGGSYIEVGMDPTGSFGTRGNAEDAPDGQRFHPVMGSNTGAGQIGLTIDPDGFENGDSPLTGDFFMPGSPEERYVLSYKKDDGATIVDNANCARQDVSWNTTDENSPKTIVMSDINNGILKAVTTGTTRDNITMASTISFKEDDLSFDTKVVITNNSYETVRDVRYCRSFDPDQDYDNNGTYYTYNKVVSNPTPDGGNDQWAVVVAKGKMTHASFFFAAHDKRARASRGVSFNPSSAYLEGLWDNAVVTPVTTPTAEDLEGISGRPEGGGNPAGGKDHGFG